MNKNHYIKKIVFIYKINLKVRYTWQYLKNKNDIRNHIANASQNIYFI